MGQQEEDNKQLAREMIDALTRADVEWVKKNYAEDFKIWAAGDLPFSGDGDKASAVAGMPAVLDLFPEGLVFTIDRMTAEGDTVAIEAHSAGTTFRGDRYEQQYHFVMRARDGQVTEWKEYMDTALAGRVMFPDGW
ncbi:MAG: nuclear transport factor 2 family protein [Myxococcota bacterium]